MLAAFAGLILFRYGRIMLGSDPSLPPPVAEERDRGPILDRRGRILAIQTSLDTVTAWKPEIEDADATIDALALALGIPSQAIRERFVTSADYVIVARTITPSQSERVRAAAIPGVRLEPDKGRYYPERDAAAAVIGYVGVDNRGLSGVEWVFDEVLLGADDASRAGGNQLFLTLDLAIQSTADALADRLLEEHGADSVRIIVAEADSGALLAVSGRPSFDPNLFSDYTAEQRRNLATTGIYEPGSVFKIFTIASFLDLNAITVADRFDTTGGYRADGGSFTITDLSDYGVIDAARIIKYSSNVGAAYASERVEAGQMYTMLTRFGFGDRTGVELNGEEVGILAPPERWSARTQQTLAIGQEIGVTALQMIAATTVFANDGVLIRPQIVHRILAPDGTTIRDAQRQPVRQVIDATTARTMLELMRGSTDPDGTARRISIDGVAVAAKTGTAEVYDPETGAYSDEHFIASTVALAPADDPELIVYVVIDFPRGESIYGGRIGAPAIDEMLEFLVPYWDVPRESDVVVATTGRIAPLDPTLPAFDRVMPDLGGLPKRTLLPLLASDQFDVTIEGNGWVIRQTPPPGAALRPGLAITLELE